MFAKFLNLLKPQDNFVETIDFIKVPFNKLKRNRAIMLSFQDPRTKQRMHYSQTSKYNKLNPEDWGCEFKILSVINKKQKHGWNKHINPSYLVTIENLEKKSKHELEVYDNTPFYQKVRRK